MKDISYIVASKNDDYDKDNLNKLILTLNANVIQLMERGIDIEPILIDWCSEVPFHTLDRIKKEIKFPINHIYVDKSLLILDGLNPQRFYEFFAKNVGIRQSNNRYILIENSDILNDDELSDSIVKLTKENLNNVYGRPSLRVNVWYPNIDEYTHYDTINDKPYGDLNPGDFMLATKDDWIKTEGYDETNSTHKTSFRQTHMDVEILFQMISKGMAPYFLNGYYRHMDHNRGGLTSYQQFGNQERNCLGYKNRETWGYSNYVPKKISENVYIISDFFKQNA